MYDYVTRKINEILLNARSQIHLKSILNERRKCVESMSPLTECSKPGRAKSHCLEVHT